MQANATRPHPGAGSGSGRRLRPPVRSRARTWLSDEPACTGDQDPHACEGYCLVSDHREHASRGRREQGGHTPWLDAPGERGPPALSIGLAVRNARHGVQRCIESILSQDFADLELVICDNVSDDGTIETLEEYARADARIRAERQRGQYRLSREHEARARRSLAAGCSAGSAPTTGSSRVPLRLRARAGEPARCDRRDHVVHDPHPDGSTRYEEYRGEFPTSPDPARRFERMLWFFHAGDAKYDPIYGMLPARAPPAAASAPPVRADRLAAQRRAGANGPDHPSRRAARQPHARLPGRRSIEPRSGVASIPCTGSSCGRPRAACTASCTPSRCRRT